MVARKLDLHIADSLACALLGLDGDAPRVARAAIGRLAPSGLATVMGGGSAPPDLAGFANGVALRYLDYNDFYLGRRDGCHPSDCIPALLAVAEAEGLAGADFRRAVAIAYEVSARFADAASLTAGGWDGVTSHALATAVATAALLDLSDAATAAAVSIAAVGGPALGQTRTGSLSMWKAGAGPASAQRGVLAGYLAGAGMTGPEGALAGEAGLARVFAGGLAWPDDEDWRILRVQLKRYPAQLTTQAAIAAAVEVAARGVVAGEVERVRVATFAGAVRSAASAPEHWRPRTRESADHSLPFVVAAALADGQLGPSQFTPERIGGADLQRLLERMVVVELTAATAAYPDRMLATVEVSLAGGERRATAVLYADADPELALAAKLTLLEEARPRAADGIGRFLADLDSTPVRDLLARLVGEP